MNITRSLWGLTSFEAQRDELDRAIQEYKSKSKRAADEKAKKAIDEALALENETKPKRGRKK